MVGAHCVDAAAAFTSGLLVCAFVIINAFQPLRMIVEAVAAIARVARGRVHTHSALAHLVLEELAFIHISPGTQVSTGHQVAPAVRT